MTMKLPTRDETINELADMKITFNGKDRHWYYGQADLGSIENVLKMPLFLDKDKRALDNLASIMKDIETAKTKGDTSLTDVIVGMFFDELQADPKDRRLLDTAIPQYVVPPEFRSFPYEKNCPARKCNEAMLRMYFNHMVEMNKFKISKSKQPDRVLTFYMDRAKRKFEDKVIEETKFDPTTVEAADYALAELYNLYKPAFISFGDQKRYSFDIFKAVIRHFIWHIKNKAIYGKNKEPYMLNISGEQGNGKTQFIRHLFQSILGNLYVETTISVLNDDFGMNLLYDCWLLFFDELIRKNGEIDVDRLKQVITSTEIKTREIFTSHHTTTFVRSSFIGAANTPIYEIIDDPTGMRRYLNLEFTNTKLVHEKSLHKLIDELWDKRGLAIWKSVDENLPNGYLVDDLERIMQVAQGTYFSPNNTVFRFLFDDQIRIVTKGVKNVVTYPLDTLYKERYIAYCNNNEVPQQYRVSIESFKKRIKHIYDTKKETKCKIANLRYVAAEESPDPEVKRYNLLWEDDSTYMEDARKDVLIPESFDIYKEFEPVEIPDAQVIIKLNTAEPDSESETDEESTEAEATEASPKFTTNEKGQKVYEDLATAVDDIKPSETFSLDITGLLDERTQGVQSATPAAESSAAQSESQSTEQSPSEGHCVPLTPGEEPSHEEILSESEKSTDEEKKTESTPPAETKVVNLSELDDSIAAEIETLEFKIHQIHRIHQKSPSYLLRKRTLEEGMSDGGRVDLRPFQFRVQAILMHEDLMEKYNTNVDVEEIERILKLESEALNNFTL